jgi:hypothetical protein
VCRPIPRERERVRRELFGARDDALRIRRNAQRITRHATRATEAHCSSTCQLYPARARGGSPRYQLARRPTWAGRRWWTVVGGEVQRQRDRDRIATQRQLRRPRSRRGTEQLT